MPDGVRLAADLYCRARRRGPARSRCCSSTCPTARHEAAAATTPLYSYFVQRGYVVARVDIRGTGNSEGRLIPYEYSDRNTRTARPSSTGSSKQPWSNGNVGMFGISWGGFNSIQMAMRNPPALKAIIAIEATEDLYQDDVHYIDGIMHVDSWEMSQDLDNAACPARRTTDRRGVLPRPLRHAAVDAHLQARSSATGRSGIALR